ncbi:MAG: hypothetical protein WC273_07750 [Dehalococcoidia bacterium]
MTTADRENPPETTNELIAVTQHVGFDVPPALDRALDQYFADRPILDGDPIFWGLIYSVNDGAWEPLERFSLIAADWDATFFPAGELMDPDGESEQDRFPSPMCLISVRTGESGSVDAARDAGRIPARQAAGLIMATTRLLAGNAPVWEGAFVLYQQGGMGFTITRRTREVRGVTPTAVTENFDALRTFHVVRRPSDYVSVARYWYARGWESSDTLERFMNFWLAAVAFVESDTGEYFRDQIRNYALHVSERAGLSPTIRDRIDTVFAEMYERRNKLFHEADFSAIAPDDVAKLEIAVHDCIRAED